MLAVLIFTIGGILGVIGLEKRKNYLFKAVKEGKSKSWLN